MSGIFQPTFRMFSGLFEYAGVLLLVAIHSMSRPKQKYHYSYRQFFFTFRIIKMKSSRIPIPKVFPGPSDELYYDNTLFAT